MKFDTKNTCPDCGVLPGDFHLQSCDIEPCPACGRQFLSCECDVDIDTQVPWLGTWPEVEDFIDFGLYAKYTENDGWVCFGKDEKSVAIANKLVRMAMEEKYA